jgi:predicted nuclease of predicted toxin-antitoxin system
MRLVIRFHLDENVDGAVARGLRDRGFDVTMPTEIGLREAEDARHLAFARSEERVLFTHDADFLRLHAGGMPHAGIVYCHPLSRSIGEIVRGLLMIAACLNAEEFRNHVEFL